MQPGLPVRQQSLRQCVLTLSPLPQLSGEKDEKERNEGHAGQRGGDSLAIGMTPDCPIGVLQFESFKMDHSTH